MIVNYFSIYLRIHGIFRTDYIFHNGFTGAASIHPLCRLTSSATIPSSISLTCRGFDEDDEGLIRSKFVWNPESLLLEAAVDDDCLDTKTTSYFRRLRSFPITTWWPYRSRAAQAFGMRRPGSVSNCRVCHSASDNYSHPLRSANIP